MIPLLRNRRHRLRVAAVVPEAGGAVSVHVTGRDLHLLDARAGQFCIWRFPDLNPWWQANPFSLSAAPNGRSLRLTAKAVGTTSAGPAGRCGPGCASFAEGPYGAFTTMHRTRPATLLVAGGDRHHPDPGAAGGAAPATVTVLYRDAAPSPTRRCSARPPDLCRTPAARSCTC